MTSPHDSFDQRLDGALEQALKTPLPAGAKQRIRTHLEQQSVPGSAPAWVNSVPQNSSATTNNIFAHKFSILGMAAAVAITAFGTYLILGVAARNAQPEKIIVEPTPPPEKEKLKSLPKEFSPDELWKNGENVATRSAVIADPVRRAKVDALLMRLRDASKQRDFETVEKITRELQDQFSPPKK